MINLHKTAHLMKHFNHLIQQQLNDAFNYLSLSIEFFNSACVRLLQLLYPAQRAMCHIILLLYLLYY